MLKNRVARIASAAAVASLALAAAAPAADAPMPTGTLKASVVPNQGLPGTPLKLKIDNRFNQPGGTVWVLTSLSYQFPKGARANGKIFKSCSVATLAAAKGQLSKCPKGSKIGKGVATGTAVDLDITSTGVLTMFNGPRGKSITMNIDIDNPAQINSTFKAPLKKTTGKYAYKLTVRVPANLQEILDGPIVVNRIQATTFATIIKDGVKRGFIEGVKCPKSGKAPMRAEFNFVERADDPVNDYPLTGQKTTTVTTTNVKCIP
jgi:hypothetical protein